MKTLGMVGLVLLQHPANEKSTVWHGNRKPGKSNFINRAAGAGETVAGSWQDAGGWFMTG
jgi:hypothetical protein